MLDPTFSPPVIERVLAEMEVVGVRAVHRVRRGRPSTRSCRNFFKSLLNSKDHTVSSAVSAVSAGAAAGQAGISTGPRTSGGGGGYSFE
jgi:hypothetical protein